MSAQLNLLDPTLHARRPVLSARHAGIALVAAMAALGVLHAALVHDVAARRAAAAALAREQQAQREALASYSRGPQTAEGRALAAEIGALESELTLQRAGIAALTTAVAGERQGYAGYLGAFSRQAVRGLWLTGITIDASAGIALRGRLLRAELLPAYIRALDGEPLLKGRTFASLEIRQAEAERDDKEVAEVAAAPRAPGYLEFTLTSREAAAQSTEKAP
jgi:hypothetical protein